MQSGKSKSAVTWIINNKISITFHELDNEYYESAITIFPTDTKFKTDGCTRFDTFDSVSCTYPGIFTCTSDTCFTIDDGKDIWKCTREGVTRENRHKDLYRYFMDNEVIFEFDGTSTYLLLKDKREPLTHAAIDWCDMIGNGSLEVIHASGSRKLARMVKETNLPISVEHEKRLLEVCR